MSRARDRAAALEAGDCTIVTGDEFEPRAASKRPAGWKTKARAKQKVARRARRANRSK